MSFMSDLLGDVYKPGMSEDEISAALEARKVVSGDVLDKAKADLSRANSQAADYKKQLRAKQSDEEAAEQARKDEMERLTQSNKELTDRLFKTEKAAELRAMGYDTKLADSTAEAMLKGDMTTVLTNQKTFIEAHDKTVKAGNLRGTPRPAAGAGSGDADYAKKIAEAQANGDYAAEAYYTRLSQQQATAAEN